MICQIIGLDPILTNGLGFSLVSSDNLVPYPPAKITNFIIFINHLQVKKDINKILTENHLWALEIMAYLLIQLIILLQI